MPTTEPKKKSDAEENNDAYSVILANARKITSATIKVLEAEKSGKTLPDEEIANLTVIVDTARNRIIDALKKK